MTMNGRQQHFSYEQHHRHEMMGQPISNSNYSGDLPPFSPLRSPNASPTAYSFAPHEHEYSFESSTSHEDEGLITAHQISNFDWGLNGAAVGARQAQRPQYHPNHVGVPTHRQQQQEPVQQQEQYSAYATTGTGFNVNQVKCTEDNRPKSKTRSQSFHQQPVQHHQHQYSEYTTDNISPLPITAGANQFNYVTQRRPVHRHYSEYDSRPVPVRSEAAAAPNRGYPRRASCPDRFEPHHSSFKGVSEWEDENPLTLLESELLPSPPEANHRSVAVQRSHSTLLHKHANVPLGKGGQPRRRSTVEGPPLRMCTVEEQAPTDPSLYYELLRAVADDSVVQQPSVDSLERPYTVTQQNYATYNSTSPHNGNMGGSTHSTDGSYSFYSVSGTESLSTSSNENPVCDPSSEKSFEQPQKQSFVRDNQQQFNHEQQLVQKGSASLPQPKVDHQPQLSPEPEQQPSIAQAYCYSLGGDSELQDSNHATRLSIPSDRKFLDPVHNFLRSSCLEVFTADEINHNPGRGAKPHQIGQMGLRCIHCKHVHRSKRAKQAVSYPSKTDNIFESVRNFQRTHLLACAYVPEEKKEIYQKLVEKVEKKTPLKYVKAYYAEAACEIGLVDTPRGLIFGAPPNLSGEPSEKLVAIMTVAQDPIASSHLEELIFPKVDERLENLKFSHICSETTRKVIENCRKEKTAFVHPSDFPTLADIRYVLYHQFLPCRPPVTALSRRKSKPEKWDTLSGLCCRYCSRAHRGENYHKGMYFPLDLDALHDSSFSHNLTVHIRTCPNAPPEIKGALEELEMLAAEHGVMTKRGSKKKFMKKLWERMSNYYPASSHVHMW